MAMTKKAKSDRLATASILPLKGGGANHARTFIAEPNIVTDPPTIRKIVAPLPTHSLSKAAPGCGWVHESSDLKSILRWISSNVIYILLSLLMRCEWDCS